MNDNPSPSLYRKGKIFSIFFGSIKILFMVIKMNGLIKKNGYHKRETTKHIPSPTEYLEGALFKMNNLMDE